jgi:hypothetical protein
VATGGKTPRQPHVRGRRRRALHGTLGPGPEHNLGPGGARVMNSMRRELVMSWKGSRKIRCHVIRALCLQSISLLSVLFL